MDHSRGAAALFDLADQPGQSRSTNDADLAVHREGLALTPQRLLLGTLGAQRFSAGTPSIVAASSLTFSAGDLRRASLGRSQPRQPSLTHFRHAVAELK